MGCLEIHVPFSFGYVCFLFVRPPAGWVPITSSKDAKLGRDKNDLILIYHHSCKDFHGNCGQFFQ